MRKIKKRNSKAGENLKGIGISINYQTQSLVMTFVNELRTDDGYQPYKGNTYKLKWNSREELIISYSYDYMDKKEINKYEIIHIEL